MFTVQAFVGGAALRCNTRVNRTCRRRQSAATVCARVRDGIAEDAKTTDIINLDGFTDTGERLRTVIEDRLYFNATDEAGRNIWDYVFVSDQACFLRTPANLLFPENLYREMQERLKSWGQRQLGCREVSQLWIEMYIQGCFRKLAAEKAPNGPFAFTYSLSRLPRGRSAASDTVIFRSSWLDTNRYYSPREEQKLYGYIQPKFDRLTVFDARFPNGVEKNDTGLNPLESRIVLTGTFTKPAPCFEGPIDQNLAAERLNDVLEPLYDKLGSMPEVRGFLSVRIMVSGSDGQVEGLRVLSNTLVPTDTREDPQKVREEIISLVLNYVSEARFGKSYGGDTYITLPISFQ